MKTLVIFLLASVGLNAQSISYRFDGRIDSFYLVERIITPISEGRRPQVVETPVFMSDTTQIEFFCQGIEKEAQKIDTQIDEMKKRLDQMVKQSNLLKGKAKAIRKERSLFLKQKP